MEYFVKNYLKLGVIIIAMLAFFSLVAKPIYAAEVAIDKYSKFDKYVVAIGTKSFFWLDEKGQPVNTNTTGKNVIIKTVFGAGVLVDEYERKILVTAKHVVFDDKGEEKPNLWIWGNKIDGKEFEYPYQMFPDAWHNVKWVKHTDDNVDIVASVIGTIGKKEAYGKKNIVEDLVDFVKLEEFKEISKLKKGDDIFYLGFPNRLGADYGSNPVLRKGMVALTEKGNKDFFYMDAVVATGNSGGPVFSLENGNSKLLGIVAEFRRFISRDSKQFHSGLGKVYSADCIKELLKSSEFQKTIEF